MLNIFTLVNGRLFQEEIESLEELSRFQPIWVDLESPTISAEQCKHMTPKSEFGSGGKRYQDLK